MANTAKRPRKLGSPLTVGSLLAGIGGFELGLERAGMQVKWQVEIDEFAREILAQHWPHAVRWHDVQTFPPKHPDEWAGFDWSVDVICGGFPCQDVSTLNYKAQGLAGSRSGLWTEFARILGEIRPAFAIVENVPAITVRGLDRILGDLAQMRFDAEWQVVPAAAFGAPHQRERVFILAYPALERRSPDEALPRCDAPRASEVQTARARNWPGRGERRPAFPDRVRWCPDSGVLRMVDGIPDRLDRYRVLGNAVVPHVSEWLGRRIVEIVQSRESRVQSQAKT